MKRYSEKEINKKIEDHYSGATFIDVVKISFSLLIKKIKSVTNLFKKNPNAFKFEKETENEQINSGKK